MTEATLETLHSKLEEARNRMVEEITIEVDRRRMLTETADLEGYGNHPGDEGTETFEREKSVAIQSHLETMVYEIDHALQRFEDGSYGNCERCGSTIPKERCPRAMSKFIPS